MTLSQTLPEVVDLRLIMQHLLALPEELLPQVYDLLLEIEEDAADARLIEQRRGEPTRTAREVFAELDGLHV